MIQVVPLIMNTVAKINTILLVLFTLSDAVTVSVPWKNGIGNAALEENK